MNKIFFTITGTCHYYGLDFFEPKMTVRLVKEPDNKHDREAIRVEAEGLGKVGYVANSAWTVQGLSWSAGRIYDKIGKKAEGTVLYKLPKGVLCYINADSVIGELPEDDDDRDDIDDCEENYDEDGDDLTIRF